MTTRCDYCDIVKHKLKAEIVYEDDSVVAVVSDLAAAPGQICVYPKQHYTILEFVPNDILDQLAQITNKISIALFESLGAQGTNILISNGTAAGQKIPHFSIEIIPRTDGDGLNLEWKPKQLMDDEADTVYLLLKEEGEKLAISKEKVEKIIKNHKTEIVLEKQDDDNYLLKQLRRIP